MSDLIATTIFAFIPLRIFCFQFFEVTLEADGKRNNYRATKSKGANGRNVSVNNHACAFAACLRP